MKFIRNHVKMKGGDLYDGNTISSLKLVWIPFNK